MKDVPMTFGFPDTLPPLGLGELRSYLWFGATGFLVLAMGFFPTLLPSRRIGLPLLACWVALPAWGLFALYTRKPRTDSSHMSSVQVKLYTLIVYGFGISFYLWARQLDLPWRVVIGALFLMEALPGVVISLTEWWRLSHLGLTVGLMVCGFGFPFVDGNRMLVLVGGAVLTGTLLSAAILYGQVRHHEASSLGDRIEMRT